MDSRVPKALDFDRRLSTMSEDIQLHVKNRKPPPMTSGKKFSLSSGWLLTTHVDNFFFFAKPDNEFCYNAFFEGLINYGECFVRDLMKRRLFCCS